MAFRIIFSLHILILEKKKLLRNNENSREKKRGQSVREKAFSEVEDGVILILQKMQVQWMKEEMARKQYCEFLIFLERVCKLNILEFE